MERPCSRLWILVGAWLVVALPPAHAVFTGTDVFLPSVGARPGVSPAVWYTTIWVHNRTMIQGGTVGAADLANAAVTKVKLAASGGTSGQVLGTD